MSSNQIRYSTILPKASMLSAKRRAVTCAITIRESFLGRMKSAATVPAFTMIG